jgi:hypothetical protein
LCFGCGEVLFARLWTKKHTHPEKSYMHKFIFIFHEKKTTPILFFKMPISAANVA